MGKMKKGASSAKGPIKKGNRKNIFKKQTKEKREVKRKIKSVVKNTDLKIEKKNEQKPLELTKIAKKNKNKRTHLASDSAPSTVRNSTRIKNALKNSTPPAENNNVQVLAKSKKRKRKGKAQNKIKNEAPIKSNKIQEPSKLKEETQSVAANNSPKVKKTKQQNSKLQTKSKIQKLQLVTDKKMRKERKKGGKNSAGIGDTNEHSQEPLKSKKVNVKKLEKMLADKKQEMVKKEQPKKQKVAEPECLRDRMMTKLRASRFRYLNETLYNNDSSESKQYFKEDPDAFLAYHKGYKQQVDQWPVNPLDIIISSIEKLPKDYIIADFGCGEATLAASVNQKVHSFDFVAMNDKVKACDMAHTPLLTNGVHVVVFCLSLMGTNLTDYIVEANRVLKKDGILKIAEVESRFDKVEEFISTLSSYGFKNTWKDLSHNLFYFLDFKKERDIGKRNKLPPITLKPCLYKKR